MKKVIAILLSVLMLFSALGMTVALAADDEEPVQMYTVRFVDWDGTVLKQRDYESGAAVKSPEYPTRTSTATAEYIFLGWSADGGETIYHANTLPPATADVTYVAFYTERLLPETQTFWQFIASVFARINMFFEYVYKIFFSA